MEWQEISVKTESEAVEAIAEVFYRLGAGGVVIEDKDTHKVPYSVVKGYLPVNQELPGKLDELKDEIAEIAGRMGKDPYEVAQVTVNEEDWANSWKKYFKPLRIGKSIVIRPTWETYAPLENDLVLDIDPGMAFGTGSHATTGLCVRFLESHIKKGMQVLDVGTGTGILAMCAAKLGASEVWAVDNDPVAVKVAEENITLNNLGNTVNVAQHDLLNGVAVKADLIVANIIAEIILKLIVQVPECLKPGGIFIASGIISERKNEIIKKAMTLNYELLEEKEEEDWAALVFQLKE